MYIVDAPYTEDVDICSLDTVVLNFVPTTTTVVTVLRDGEGQVVESM